MLLQTDIPVPKDIPLDLPLPEWLLVTLLVVSFIAHILFVNMMVGGSIVTLWAEIKGIKEKDYDTFASEIAATITVNKSLAVVLGVAPLLSINALYTLYFYSANALTGFAWIMIIPLVTIAFLLTYLHKYTWKRLTGSKTLHILIIGLSVALFLVIPLIFLTNVNLMMFPEKWAHIKGFTTALMLPNVLPRYFEFLGACIAVTGIFIVWYNGREAYAVEKIYEKLSRYDLQKTGYSVSAAGLGLQIFFGIIVLFSLPSKGIDSSVLLVMCLSGLCLGISLRYCYLAISGKKQCLNRHFSKVVAGMAVFTILYGGSRQMYRHNALEKHQKLVAFRTAEFAVESKKERENPTELTADTFEGSQSDDATRGTTLFNTHCAACHQAEQKLVGPPVIEMLSIYRNNEDGLKNWIKSPGKKRADAPQMPGFPQLSSDDLNELANYILSYQL